MKLSKQEQKINELTEAGRGSVWQISTTTPGPPVRTAR